MTRIEASVGQLHVLDITPHHGKQNVGRRRRSTKSSMVDDFSQYTTRRVGTGRERIRSVACEPAGDRAALPSEGAAFYEGTRHFDASNDCLQGIWMGVGSQQVVRTRSSGCTSPTRVSQPGARAIPARFSLGQTRMTLCPLLSDPRAATECRGHTGEVQCVRWSPVHPERFVSVSGSGTSQSSLWTRASRNHCVRFR